ncbi:MAG: M23 family metallopeptidase [Gemmatimonadota bacterium]|nr:MAG: M23 family metallopeptidase [Gemmatimonadota bacterium]
MSLYQRRGEDGRTIQRWWNFARQPFLSGAVSGLAGLALLLTVSSCELPTDSRPEPAAGVRFPLESWRLTQDFGVWNNSWGGYHLAEDVAASGGDPLYAMADGVVRGAFTEVQGYGAVMLIEHRFADEFVVSLYGHVSTRRGFEVAPGEPVTKGDLVGYIADDDEDGGSWPPHLHFGIRKGPYSLEERICDLWLYVGYTRSCEEITHEEYLELWYDPTDFILGRVGPLAAP